MRKLFAQLHADDSGSVTLEYLVLMTFVGLGVIVGAHTLGAALNAEAVEVAQAIVSLDQGYDAGGYSACNAIKTGSGAIADVNGPIAASPVASDPGTIQADFCNPTVVVDPN